MSTIQAIETAYKGYRFRSRLEARWAMFYDRIGCEWSYEPQPLSINGEAYLPDFLVTYRGSQIVHEVKSHHERSRIRTPSVYLAGKMGEEHDWRGRDISVSGYHMDGGGLEWLRNAKSCFLHNAYVKVIGPFEVGGNHCYVPIEASAHGAESYATGDGQENSILKTCLTSIQEADVFCAHISTPDAYGTLVEIGFAKGNNPTLPISLSIEQSLIATSRGHSQDDRNDLWFPSHLANLSMVVNGFEEARAFHASFIKTHTTRELRRISGIGKERPAIITFGDPLDVAGRTFIGWKDGWMVGHLCAANKAVAEQVRAHRFDGR